MIFPPALRWNLEAEHWAESGPEVVSAAVVEVNFVADFKPQSERTHKAFHAPARIESELCVTVRDRPQRTGKSRQRSAVGRIKVHKTDLPGHKKTDWTGSLKFWPEQPSQRASLGPHEIGSDAVIEGTSEVAAEIVSHFGFQLDIAVHVERDVATNADKIDLRSGRAEAEEIGECAYLNVILGRLGPQGCGQAEAGQ